MLKVTIDYCGNYIYEDGTLSRILIDGGYITFESNIPKYHFYIQDHLGNIRVVADQSGVAEQVNHYYPYGGIIADISTNQGLQRHKYNGKEYDRMYGLNLYDYGARHYDPATLAWTAMDPLAEKYYPITPYGYCHSNPVMYVDENGDSTRVYTETNSLGHTWMSIGEGNDIIVYSYGRYNGTDKGQKGKSSGTNLSNGQGVLLRFTGKEAKNYLADKNKDGMSTFVITDVSDNYIQNLVDKLFFSSSKLPDNPQSKYYKSTSAHIIDNYILWNNNCTTFVSDVINNAGSNSLVGYTMYTNPYGISTTYRSKQRFINPRSMQSFLIQQSKHHNNVYKSK